MLFEVYNCYYIEDVWARKQQNDWLVFEESCLTVYLRLYDRSSSSFLMLNTKREYLLNASVKAYFNWNQIKFKAKLDSTIPYLVAVVSILHHWFDKKNNFFEEKKWAVR